MPTAGTCSSHCLARSASMLLSTCCPSCPICSARASRAAAPWGKRESSRGAAFALEPVLANVCSQPVWRHQGQGVEGVLQGACDQFQAIERANGGQYMGGVGAL